MYKCIFFAVYTFFVGTADEKFKKVLQFPRGSGDFRRKIYKIFVVHFSFSVVTKNVKILLQARKGLNLELAHLYFLSVGEVIV